MSRRAIGPDRSERTAIYRPGNRQDYALLQDRQAHNRRRLSHLRHSIGFLPPVLKIHQNHHLEDPAKPLLRSRNYTKKQRESEHNRPAKWRTKGRVNRQGCASTPPHPFNHRPRKISKAPLPWNGDDCGDAYGEISPNARHAISSGNWLLVFLRPSTQTFDSTDFSVASDAKQPPPKASATHEDNPRGIVK